MSPNLEMFITGLIGAGCGIWGGLWMLGVPGAGAMTVFMTFFAIVWLLTGVRK